MPSKFKIGIGSVQFGMPYGISNRSGQTPQEEVCRILDFARQNGIRVLDTASAYGEAENILGMCDLTGFQVISKFMPPGPDEVMEKQLAKSLKKLGTDHLYGYLAHRPGNLLTHPKQWGELKKLREQGRVKKIGYSLNILSELKELLEAGFSPDLVQLPYNYFDRRFETCFAGLKEQGCEIHVRSVFLQGLFFTNPERLPKFFDEVKPVLRFLQQEIENLAGALMKFALENCYVDRVIMGVNNCTQLAVNLGSLQRAGSLPDLTHTVTEDILTPFKWPALQPEGDE